MDLETFKNTIDIADCQCSPDTPVYASQVNSNGMSKVIGVQVKKAFTDNGTENDWIEIIFSDGVVPNK